MSDWYFIEIICIYLITLSLTSVPPPLSPSLPPSLCFPSLPELCHLQKSLNLLLQKHHV